MAATERHIRTRRPRTEPVTPRTRVLPREEAAGAIIDFEDVVKRYPSGDLGLNGASFAIHPGEFVFIVGASGSGKSTLMRLLIKEVEPTTGYIRVAGRDLSEIPRNRVPYYRRNIGMVHQDFKLLPNRTGNLDPETSVGIMQLLYRINKTGTTVVVVTHDHQMVDRMRRRVIELSKGKVIRDERRAGYSTTQTTAELGAVLREHTE
jgi:ABC-type ATPase involved in cell division